MIDPTIYKVIFYNQNNVFEIYAKNINPNKMLGFIELSDLIFANSSNLILNSVEEKMKAEFANVKKTYIPLNSIIRIDNVIKAEKIKIYKSDSIIKFPLSSKNDNELKK